MERIPRLRQKAALALAILLPSLAVTACLNMQPKILGQQGKFDFGAFNTNGSGSFKFNFALVNTTNSTIYLQGNSAAKSTLVGTCNFAGTGCSCNFLDVNGNTLATTSSTQISYDDTGNYYRCVYSGAANISNVASVVIQNLGGSVTSGAITVNNTTTNPPSLAQLIGSDLDINRVRYVFRYQCQFNYLQKAGTTTQGFDCTNVATSCDPNGNVANNFCLLKARWPFYLFTDTFSSNFSQKPSDKIYNGSGTGSLCGLQIKQFDCVGTATDPFGTPTKQYGLYDQLQGIWQTSVQLPAGPDQASASYGFAAQESPVTRECPPGLVKKVFFTSTIITSDITPSHNFASNQVATEVSDPTITPPPFEIQKFGSGGCTGTTCTLPGSFAGDAKTSQAYSSATQTEFCVIPPNLLP